MKTNDDTVRVLPSLLSRFLLTVSLILPVQLVGAHNNVVVVPLLSDEAQQQPTSPVALVDPSQTDYTIFLDGSVIDNITNLQWQRQDDNVLRNWNEALDYCAGLTLGGSSDWRLPDVVELQSIVDYRQSSPAINSLAFPGTSNVGYWSASNDANNSIEAWFVVFDNGAVNNINKGINIFVRCVR